VFPMTVRHKSASVTIYRSPNRGIESHTVTYHSEGARRRGMRRDFIARILAVSADEAKNGYSGNTE